MPNYLDVPSGSSASAPNVAAYNGTQGPFEFIASVAPTTWTPGGALFPTLLGSIAQPGKVDRHSIYINPSGQIEHYWQNASPATIFAQSTAVVPFGAGARGWVRTTLDLAAGTCDFATSTDGSSWSALGTQVTGISTSPLSSAGAGADYRIGFDNSANDNFTGKIYRSKFSANGVVLYDMDWTTATVGTGPWVGADGLTWTRTGTASVVAEPAAAQAGVNFQRKGDRRA